MHKWTVSRRAIGAVLFTSAALVGGITAPAAAYAGSATSEWMTHT